eukprot:INCI17139.2.p1 GENE.INCI17139.2~~INCI17139.2.p1  ORF type:complete len:303 (-),score=37.92 INCI17139.2:48-956(-)
MTVVLQAGWISMSNISTIAKWIIVAAAWYLLTGLLYDFAAPRVESIFGHGVQNPQTLARPQPVEVNHSSSQGVATRNIESDLMAAQGQPVTERHLTTVPPIHEVVDGGIHCHLQRGYVCKGTNHHAQELEQCASERVDFDAETNISASFFAWNHARRKCKLCSTIAQDQSQIINTTGAPNRLSNVLQSIQVNRNKHWSIYGACSLGSRPDAGNVDAFQLVDSHRQSQERHRERPTVLEYTRLDGPFKSFHCRWLLWSTNSTCRKQTGGVALTKSFENVSTSPMLVRCRILKKESLSMRSSCP